MAAHAAREHVRAQLLQRARMRVACGCMRTLAVALRDAGHEAAAVVNGAAHQLYGQQAAGQAGAQGGQRGVWHNGGSGSGCVVSQRFDAMLLLLACAALCGTAPRALMSVAPYTSRAATVHAAQLVLLRRAAILPRCRRCEDAWSLLKN